MEEKRRRRRIAIRMPVIWKKEGNAKQNCTEAFLLDIHNLTTSGLFLKTNMRQKKGAHVDLLLNLNDKTKPIKLRGKVRWIADKKKQPYLYPGLGIEFENISRDEYRRLSVFIKNKLANFRDARELKNMYIKLKNMAWRLVELEERYASATHFKKVIDNAIKEIDEVAHILDREINEIKNM